MTGERLAAGSVLASIAAGCALAVLLWLSTRPSSTLVDLAAVFGYVFLVAVAVVLTLAALSRVRRADESSHGADRAD